MLNLDAVGGRQDEGTAVATVQTYDLDIVRPKFEDYRREALRIAAEAKELTVTDDESLNVAVMIGGNAKKIAKTITAQVKAIVAEPEDFVKGVKAIGKAITDALDEAERTAKQKISQHQAKVELERRKEAEAARKAAEELQEKLRKEAEEANRKAREEAARKAEEEARARAASQAEIDAARNKAAVEAQKYAIEAPAVISPVIPEATKVVRTAAAASFQRKEWKHEITDPEAVPRDYCDPSPARIREAIKAGIREIPGVRIYEDSTTVFRT